MSDKNTVVIASPEELGRVDTRRSFLRMLGVGGSIVLLPSVFAACGDDDGGPFAVPGTRPGGSSTAVVLNLNDDIGILNYAYALEQLEAAFYTQVVGLSNFSTLFNAVEQEVMTDLYRHEVIHREFFRAAIPAARRLPDLAVNFGTVISAPTRAGIGAATVDFEDTGVSAYNGAGQYLKSADFLTLAGKIVSVEARHAAVTRTLFLSTPNTAFADLASIQTADNTNALDAFRLPGEVFTKVKPFITTNLTVGSAPV